MHTYYFKGENSITFTLRKVFVTYLVIPRQKNVRFFIRIYSWWHRNLWCL